MTSPNSGATRRESLSMTPERSSNTAYLPSGFFNFFFETLTSIRVSLHHLHPLYAAFRPRHSKTRRDLFVGKRFPQKYGQHYLALNISVMACTVEVAKEITVIFGGCKLFEIHSLSLLSCEPLGMQRSGIVCQKVYFLVRTKQRKT